MWRLGILLAVLAVCTMDASFADHLIGDAQHALVTGPKTGDGIVGILANHHSSVSGHAMDTDLWEGVVLSDHGCSVLLINVPCRPEIGQRTNDKHRGCEGTVGRVQGSSCSSPVKSRLRFALQEVSYTWRRADLGFVQVHV